MQQSRVISCAWPHRPMRTVAFILSLLPCPTRFVTWCEERASFLCVAARAISHGGLYIFVTAFPCPVSVAGWRKGLSFLRRVATDNAHGGFHLIVSAFPCPVRCPVRGRVHFFAPPHIFLSPIRYCLFPKTVGRGLAPAVHDWLGISMDIRRIRSGGTKAPPYGGNSVLRMEFEDSSARCACSQ